MKAIRFLAFLWAGVALVATLAAKPLDIGTNITVNTTEGTITPNGNCSLPEAVQAANSNAEVDGCNAGVGTDTIRFSIGSGAQTIALASTLHITTTMTIDGTSQPGYDSVTGVPVITVTTGWVDLIALEAGSAGSWIKHLRLQVTDPSAPPGTGVIHIDSNSNVVIGNYFNTDGAAATANNQSSGVVIDGGDWNDIGRSAVLDRNLFGGGRYGLRILDGASNSIENNYFGVQAAGSTLLTGLVSSFPAVGMCETGTGICTGNALISNVMGGFGTGIWLGPSASSNFIEGNRLGLGADGTTRIGGTYGIKLQGAFSNMIGGTTAAERNIISGNTTNISIDDDPAHHPDGNIIRGNYIGTTADGLGRVTPYGDATYDLYGVSVLGGNNNVIGGTTTGSGNLISANQRGIYVGAPASFTGIWGNWIGTDATGSAALMQQWGIYLSSGSSTGIGDYINPGNNVISGNVTGISIVDGTPTIYGNRIGMAALGNAGVPNETGIQVQGTSVPAVTANWIGHNLSIGLSVSSGANLSGGSSGNCFTGNTAAGVWAGGLGPNLPLTNNWWGSSTGPTSVGNPGGTGDETNGPINFTPFLRKPPIACSPVVSDFEDDSQSDPAKFTSTGAVWYIQSSTGTWQGQFVGTDGTYIARSDFDGDHKTDPAKFVGGDSIWYLGSATGSWHGVYMGSDGALVAGGDYDGDGKTDPAKFVSGTGIIWYFGSLDSAWHGVMLGTDGTPIAASDFDGDGKTDAAKFVSGAIWYFGSLDSTWHGVYIGTDGEVVAGSDYDGDGKTDPAKYVLASGAIWYLGSSDASWHASMIGTDGNPIPANDFDGDGRTDAAKFVPAANSIWYIASSTGGWQGAWLGTDSYTLAN